ncbi:helix-turn-helix domain-containing protein [Micromonospora sp. NPDC049081]|uniref:helix-turn-helix domain-containing protein n=1 Tax=Micromonospora sp. NPDC049081 TaxID=3155150 RepID=UPI00340E63C3
MATMTTTQAAAKLGVSIRTIQRHCATGKLAATKNTRGRWTITMEYTVTLPALTDTNPDLVRIAEGDRTSALARLTDQLTNTAGNAPAELVASMIGLYREVALRHTDARWWLNNNSRPLGPILQREFTADDKARLVALAARR